jgi:putative colanic acid biosynthesis UDP-glucose lipid carrier transferase
MIFGLYALAVYAARIYEPMEHLWYMPILWVALALVLFSSRMLARNIIRRFRTYGINNRRVLFVGAGHNLRYLYDELTDNPTTGFRVKGYFDESTQNQFTDVLPRLGGIAEIESYLKKQPVDIVFCNLTSRHNKEILELMNYCENHLIRFYSVPNVRNYVHHVMQVEMVGNMPVLSLREEPLNQPYNRIIKRIFDIIVSLLFLCTIFPFIYIFCAIGIKLSSKGPVFFKQKRTGMRGEEFTCYKFRSMHQNDQADTLQATKHDPRKFPFGDFIRRTNLDETPQFINVLRGEMSIVGPRPHMLKHTEEYSQLVDKYMVRHWAKPGITGWAQVTGARGETEHLWQMEERIRKDVWYIENYSFMLDMQIIILTIKTIFLHDDEHAY